MENTYSNFLSPGLPYTFGTSPFSYLSDELKESSFTVVGYYTIFGPETMVEGETIRYELYAPFLLSEAKFDECFNWSCLRAGLFDASMHATGHYLSTHLEKIYNEKVKLPDLLTIFNI